MYRLSRDKELTDEKLGYFMNQHQADVNNRLRNLANAYQTKFPIFYNPPKEPWKPDNRIAVNFPKYIVDTMNGFILGNPAKVLVQEEDEGIADYVEVFEQYNNIDDHNAELSKTCSIFGRGYELLYVDDFSQICVTHVSPMEGFMIFDDSVLERPRYFVRIYKDEDEVLHGTVSDHRVVRYFSVKGKFVWEDEKLHGFDGVPAIEYVENEEKLGIYEPVLSMVNAYNKAISEKANDVDYFADAYLKVLGAYLDDDDTKHMRNNRIINFEETLSGGTLPEVDFLSKPNGDTTQENLINRLEKLIFQISMVANINDENFGTSSGIAMKYKLQSMSNLEKTKERKLIAGMTRRYKLIFSNPLSGMNPDDFAKLHYRFTPNFPANVLEESQIAQGLSGIVSKETQLSVLSVVDNVKEEIEKMEQEEDAIKQDAIVNQMFEMVTQEDSPKDDGNE